MVLTKFPLWDFHSALTTICLVDYQQNLQAWSELIFLFEILLDEKIFESPDAPTLREKISAFQPTAFWRCDPGIWQTAVYASNTNDDILAIYMGSGLETHILMKCEHGNYQLRRNGCEYFSKFPQALNLFETAVSQRTIAEVPTKLILWTARGHDTMSKVSQFAILQERYGSRFHPTPVVRDKDNMLSADDAFGSNLAEQFERAVPSEAWRLENGTNFNIIESFRPKKAEDEFIYQKMGEIVQHYANQAVPNREILGEQESFKILISFELEKRQFAEQQDFFRQFIARSRTYFPRVRVFVNGMTGYVDGGDSFQDIRDREEALMKDIFADLPVEFVHLHNKTFVEKAQITKHLDFFVGPLGNACLLPGLLGIPGVTYASNDMTQSFGWFMKYCRNLIEIDKMKVTSLVADTAMRRYQWGHTDGTRMSYSIDVDYLLSLCENYLSQVAANDDRQYS